ncbi:isoprenoid synthase domain-containing protein [Aspergillus floccosus]
MLEPSTCLNTFFRIELTPPRSLIFRTAEFACGPQIPQKEVDVLDGLRSLCARHVLLTNDLYSFEKEAAAEMNGVKLFNAVRVVQDLMGVLAPSAKAILRNIIWDVERRMHEEYERLVAKSSASQLVRARALVACVAGNMYFSATCARYARVVDGARLAA